MADDGLRGKYWMHQVTEGEARVLCGLHQKYCIQHVFEAVIMSPLKAMHTVFDVSELFLVCFCKYWPMQHWHS